MVTALLLRQQERLRVGNSAELAFVTHNNGTDSRERIRIDRLGNVGIGTSTPQDKLQIQGGSALVKTIRTGTNSEFPLIYGTQHVNGTVGLAGLYLFEDGSGGFGQASGISFKTSVNDVNPVTNMVIRGNGNVGIGVTDPGNYKLGVNGTIHSKAVVVDLVGWSDYVFNKNYQLPTLAQVKTYIDQNHHLPNMPSAAEVEKD